MTVLEGLVADAKRELNQQGRYVTAEDVVAALNRAQTDYFGFALGSPTTYQPGRPVPVVTVALTTRLEEELRPFKVGPLAVLVEADGYLAAPDYTPPMAYPVRLTLTFSDGTTSTSAGVRWKDEQRWDELSSSLLTPPSIRYPIGRTTANGWQVLPAPTSAKVTFYRYPAPMKLAFSGQDDEGNDIVDLGATVDCEWPTLAHAEILRRAVLALSTQYANPNAERLAATQQRTPA